MDGWLASMNCSPSSFGVVTSLLSSSIALFPRCRPHNKPTITRIVSHTILLWFRRRVLQVPPLATPYLPLRLGGLNWISVRNSSRRMSDHGVEDSTISGRIGVLSGVNKGELYPISWSIIFETDRSKAYSRWWYQTKETAFMWFGATVRWNSKSTFVSYLEGKVSLQLSCFSTGCCYPIWGAARKFSAAESLHKAPARNGLKLTFALSSRWYFQVTCPSLMPSSFTSRWASQFFWTLSPYIHGEAIWLQSKCLPLAKR